MDPRKDNTSPSSPDQGANRRPAVQLNNFAGPSSTAPQSNAGSKMLRGFLYRRKMDAYLECKDAAQKQINLNELLEFIATMDDINNVLRNQKKELEAKNSKKAFVRKNTVLLNFFILYADRVTSIIDLLAILNAFKYRGADFHADGINQERPLFYFLSILRNPAFNLFAFDEADPLSAAIEQLESKSKSSGQPSALSKSEIVAQLYELVLPGENVNQPFNSGHYFITELLKHDSFCSMMEVDKAEEKWPQLDGLERRCVVKPRYTLPSDHKSIQPLEILWERYQQQRRSVGFVRSNSDEDGKDDIDVSAKELRLEGMPLRLVQAKVKNKSDNLLHSLVLSILVPLLKDSSNFVIQFKKLFGDKIPSSDIEKIRENIDKYYNGSPFFIEERAPELQKYIDTSLRERLANVMREDKGRTLKRNIRPEQYEQEIKSLSNPSAPLSARVLQASSQLLERHIVITGKLSNVFTGTVSNITKMEFGGEHKASPSIQLIFSDSSYGYLAASQALSPRRRKQVDDVPDEYYQVERPLREMLSRTAFLIAKGADPLAKFHDQSCFMYQLMKIWLEHDSAKKVSGLENATLSFIEKYLLMAFLPTIQNSYEAKTSSFKNDFKEFFVARSFHFSSRKPHNNFQELLSHPHASALVATLSKHPNFDEIHLKGLLYAIENIGDKALKLNLLQAMDSRFKNSKLYWVVLNDIKIDVYQALKFREMAKSKNRGEEKGKDKVEEKNCWIDKYIDSFPATAFQGGADSKYGSPLSANAVAAPQRLNVSMDFKVDVKSDRAATVTIAHPFWNLCRSEENAILSDKDREFTLSALLLDLKIEPRKLATWVKSLSEIDFTLALPIHDRNQIFQALRQLFDSNMLIGNLAQDIGILTITQIFQKLLPVNTGTKDKFIIPWIDALKEIKDAKALGEQLTHYLSEAQLMAKDEDRITLELDAVIVGSSEHDNDELDDSKKNKNEKIGRFKDFLERMQKVNFDLNSAKLNGNTILSHIFKMYYKFSIIFDEILKIAKEYELSFRAVNSDGTTPLNVLIKGAIAGDHGWEAVTNFLMHWENDPYLDQNGLPINGMVEYLFDEQLIVRDFVVQHPHYTEAFLVLLDEKKFESSRTMHLEKYIAVFDSRQYELRDDVLQRVELFVENLFQKLESNKESYKYLLDIARMLIASNNLRVIYVFKDKFLAMFNKVADLIPISGRDGIKYRNEKLLFDSFCQSLSLSSRGDAINLIKIIFKSIPKRVFTHRNIADFVKQLIAKLSNPVVRISFHDIAHLLLQVIDENHYERSLDSFFAQLKLLRDRYPSSQFVDTVLLKNFARHADKLNLFEVNQFMVKVREVIIYHEDLKFLEERLKEIFSLSSDQWHEKFNTLNDDIKHKIIIAREKDDKVTTEIQQGFLKVPSRYDTDAKSNLVPQSLVDCLRGLRLAEIGFDDCDDPTEVVTQLTKSYKSIRDEVIKRHDDYRRLTVKPDKKDDEKNKDKKGYDEKALALVTAPSQLEPDLALFSNIAYFTWISNLKMLPHYTQMMTAMVVTTLASQKADYVKSKREAGGLPSIIAKAQEELIHYNILAQVDTGQGKSLIIAMIAAALAKHGHQVHVITTDAANAQRDAVAFEPVFQQLGVPSAYYKELGFSKAGFKPNGDGSCVIYGKLSNFMQEVSRQQWCLLGDDDYRAGNYQFSLHNTIAIIDEIDVVINNRAGDIYAYTNYSLDINWLIKDVIWDRREQHRCNYAEVKRLVNESAGYRSLSADSPTKKYIDENLQGLCFHANAARNAKEADLDQMNLIRGEHGFIHLNRKANDLQQNMVSDGQQFYELQFYGKIKYNICFATNLISSDVFLRKYYTGVYGVTGTVGTPEELAYARRMHDFTAFNVPRYRNSKEAVASSYRIVEEQHWLSGLMQVNLDKIRQGRPVLNIINYDDIKKVADFFKKHKEFEDCVQVIKVVDQDYKEITKYVEAAGKLIEDEKNPGQRGRPRVTFCVPSYGRGADYKTSFDVNQRGGLHVVIGYYPETILDEIQCRGRTARHGDKGSWEYFLNHTQGRQFVESAGIVYEERKAFDCLSEARTKKLTDRLEIYEKRFRRSQIMDSTNRFFDEIRRLKETRMLDAKRLPEVRVRWAFFVERIFANYLSEEQLQATIADNVTDIVRFATAPALPAAAAAAAAPQVPPSGPANDEKDNKDSNRIAAKK